MSADDSFEPRACVACGYVRRVRIRRWNRQEDQWSWSKLCTACEYDRRAVRHAALAKKYALRAAHEHQMRKRKKEKP